MHEATELDIYYVENYSLGLDLKIIAHAATVKRQHSLGARAEQMPVPFACD